MLPLRRKKRAVSAALLTCALLSAGVATDVFADTQTRTIAGTVAAPGWSNSGNVASIDGSCAFPNDANPQPILLTNWGFTIPGGSTINGISVTAQGASTAGDNIIQMIQGGTAQGNTQNAGISGGGCNGTSDTVGAANDLWGLAWTPASINAANFGVSYDAQFQGRQFDGVSITVDFTPPPTIVDLSVTKSDDVDPVTAGNQLVYTIDVSNDFLKGGTADNVIATDTLPPGVTFVSTSGCNNDPAGVPNCQLGSIANFDSAQYTVTVTVDPDTAPGTITNNVSVTTDDTDIDNGNDTASEDTQVVVSADLSITKTDSADPVNAGENLTYTITVNNAGPSDAQNVVVTDTLPAGVTLVSTSGCAEDPNGVPTCTLGTVAAGGSAQYTVTVAVDPGLAPGVISNTATVTTSTNDPNIENDSTGEDTTITNSADLSVTKTDDADPAAAGGQLIYTITVNNAGPSDASNVVATETLPAGVTFVSSTGCAEDPNGVPTCTLGNIAAGGSAQYTVTVDIDPMTSGTITNSVSVTSDTPDPTPANNTQGEDTLVELIADVRIVSITDNPDPAQGMVTYQVFVNNLGPSMAFNTTVEDILPFGLGFVETNGCGNDPNGVPTCDIGNMPPGAFGGFTIKANIGPIDGVISNTVTISTTSNDPDLSNNTGTATTTVSAFSIPTLSEYAMLLMIALLSLVAFRFYRNQAE